MQNVKNKQKSLGINRSSSLTVHMYKMPVNSLNRTEKRAIKHKRGLSGLPAERKRTK